MSKRRIIIGDIHGCISELEMMIKKVNYNSKYDQLYTVGDLIHKGPESLKVIELAQELNIKSVLGNNEAHAVKAYEKSNLKYDFSYLEKLFGFKLEEAMNYICSLPLWMDLDDLWLVHAGFDPRFSHPKNMSAKVLLTIRTWDGIGENLNNHKKDPAWYDAGKWDKPIVFGHWASNGIVEKENFIGLDSGCVYGKTLSAYCPEESQIYSVLAKKTYQAIVYK